MTAAERTTLRKEVGTQAEVARLLGVSKRTIERWENEATYGYAEVFRQALRTLLFDRRVAQTQVALDRLPGRSRPGGDHDPP